MRLFGNADDRGSWIRMKQEAERQREPSPPRRRHRWRWYAALVLLAWVLFWWAGGWLARSVLVWAARRYAGWKIQIGELSAQGFPMRFRIANLTLANPEGFAEGTALMLRELYVERGGRARQPRETVLQELRVDIGRIALHRLANGETNFDRLLAKLESPMLTETISARPRSTPMPPAELPAPPLEGPMPLPPSSHEAASVRKAEETSHRPSPMPRPARTPPPPRTWRIERLVVTLGEVELNDELNLAGPKTLTLNRTLVFTNVTDFALVATQLSAALAVFTVPQMFEDIFRVLDE